MRLLSPLLAGSLERGLNLAEAMEARGYGPASARARRGRRGARSRRARRVGR
jgi:energy-coupling factor transporter transmembrane protein EcfT